MTKTTNATTTRTLTVAVRLSCNHTLRHDGDHGHDLRTAEEGAKLPCPKCPARADGASATRRIKELVTTKVEVPADEVAEVFEAIAAPVAPAIRAAGPTVRVTNRTHHQLAAATEHLAHVLVDTPDDLWHAVTLRGTPAELIEIIRAAAAPLGRRSTPLHSLRRAVEQQRDVDAVRDRIGGRKEHVTRTPPPAPAADEVTPENYDRDTARAEHKAVAAWIAAGRQGTPPATPHLDAMNAAHAAGRPRGGAKAKPSRPRNTDPVRLAANDARKTKGTGGRHQLRRVTADELHAYVVAAVTENPSTRSVDLRDYALWVDEVSVSYKRWDAAYEQVLAPVVAALTGH